MWIQVVEDLVPFDKIGYFVSMARYSMKAVVPFSGLGASVLVGFSFAFRVLFNPKFYRDEDGSDETGGADANGTVGNDTRSEDDDSHEDESSFFRVLKILFHAAVGNFEEEVRLLMLDTSHGVCSQVFRSTDTFIGVWRSLLFNGFIFVGGIVLLSLLIAILGDTYNRVRSTEEEELVKCRAELAGATLRYIAHRFVPPEENSQ